MLIIKNVNIDLKATITCGQIFRYEEENDNSYTIIYSDRIINIKQDNNNLIVKSNNEENIVNIVKDYLSLDKSYDEMNKVLLKADPSLKEIIDYCTGFKIMKTPKFETIISYIISQNNRVAQIKKSLDNISKEYGKKVVFNNKEYYLFPTEKELSKCTIEKLREAKVGFRDKYIYEFIQNVNDNKFAINKIDNLNTKDALIYLMQNKGIGLKVASCILLFAYERYDVFPIDTWVKKYMKEHYNLETQKEIEDYSKNKFKNYSGLFIQYIFHYNRNM